MIECLQAIIRRTFGDHAQLDTFEKWGFGALNDTYKVVVRDPPQVVFVKIEREGILPTTRRGQVGREVGSMQLMRQVGIDCPVVLGHDAVGRELGCTYLVEQFIDGQLLWELRDQLTPDEREQMRRDVEMILQKMSRLTRSAFGDVREGGPVCQHANWRDAYIAMTVILLNDARALELFTPDQQRMVAEAMHRAGECLVSTYRAGWIHGDLGLHNVMADRSSGSVRVGRVIDFGNAWFGPVYANEDGCRRYGGFGLEVQDVAARYGVSKAEYDADELLFTLEQTVFMAMLARRNNQPVQQAVDPFLRRCRA